MKSFTLVLVILFSHNCFAQSIRKDYKEMTQSEKNLLVNLFYELREGEDLIDDLATFHGTNFDVIHYNLPNNPQNDVFLAWHRRQIFEVEQAMQDINPRASIPFWDWTEENTTSSNLWHMGFMGSFDDNWNLGRNLGGMGTLPSPNAVNSVQSISNWLSYSNNFERSNVHSGPHIWVGGEMQNSASPRDPIFYLHHGMVDKLWQNWVEANGITPSSNIYQMTSLPRYDGTYSFNGSTLPTVNPNDIVDANASLGVFFAENKLAILDNYTVSNTYRARETFYYQFDISLRDGFTVPSQTAATVETVIGTISIEPEFIASIGSEFIAKIDQDANILTSEFLKDSINPNQIPFAKIDILENAYILKGDDKVSGKNVKLDSKSVTNTLSVYPNPTYAFCTIDVGNMHKSLRTIEIFDTKGLKIIDYQINGSKTITVDLRDYSSGMYTLILKSNEGIMLGSTHIIKL